MKKVPSHVHGSKRIPIPTSFWAGRIKEFLFHFPVSLDEFLYLLPNSHTAVLLLFPIGLSYWLKEFRRVFLLAWTNPIPSSYWPKKFWYLLPIGLHKSYPFFLMSWKNSDIFFLLAWTNSYPFFLVAWTNPDHSSFWPWQIIFLITISLDDFHNLLPFGQDKIRSRLKTRYYSFFIEYSGLFAT